MKVKNCLDSYACVPNCDITLNNNGVIIKVFRSVKYDTAQKIEKIGLPGSVAYITYRGKHAYIVKRQFLKFKNVGNISDIAKEFDFILINIINTTKGL